MFRKPPTAISKHNSVDPPTNPFDSDSDSDVKPKLQKTARSSSEPNVLTGDSKYKTSPDPYNNNNNNNKYKYKNDFRESGGFENQSVQELESYAVYKSEETTHTVNNCLKIAEDIREDATNTLVTLHKQGEQITRTHAEAADIQHNLSRGEKLLGSLGGMFSKTWKPSKGREIKGPVLFADVDPIKRKANHIEQRQKLGLSNGSQGNPQRKYDEPTSAMEKVQVEKAKQDDGLTDLSNMLGELKGMAVDMGSEIERQNKALDHMQDDVDELNYRVKGATQRGRRLLGK